MILNANSPSLRRRRPHNIKEITMKGIYDRTTMKRYKRTWNNLPNGHTETSKAQTSKAMTGPSNHMFGTDDSPIARKEWQRECPKCKKTMSKALYTRWFHGEDCLQRPKESGGDV